ncbi:dTDP-4-dehydrorhamnose 3,5-epimerase family protein [Bradyrhizobium sp. USDA 4518]
MLKPPLFGSLRIIPRESRRSDENCSYQPLHHYQKPPMAEMKMVRWSRGGGFDVAVDLRKNSLRWTAVGLAPDNASPSSFPNEASQVPSIGGRGAPFSAHRVLFTAPTKELSDSMRLWRALVQPLPSTDLAGRDSEHLIPDAELKGE